MVWLKIWAFSTVLQFCNAGSHKLFIVFLGEDLHKEHHPRCLRVWWTIPLIQEETNSPENCQKVRFEIFLPKEICVMLSYS